MTKDKQVTYKEFIDLLNRDEILRNKMMNYEVMVFGSDSLEDTKLTVKQLLNRKFTKIKGLYDYNVRVKRHLNRVEGFHLYKTDDLLVYGIEFGRKVEFEPIQRKNRFK